MDKKELANALLELFKDGTIQLETTIDHDKWGKNLVTSIIINKEVVLSKRTTITYK